MRKCIAICFAVIFLTTLTSKPASAALSPPFSDAQVRAMYARCLRMRGLSGAALQTYFEKYFYAGIMHKYTGTLKGAESTCRIYLKEGLNGSLRIERGYSNWWNNRGESSDEPFVWNCPQGEVNTYLGTCARP